MAGRRTNLALLVALLIAMGTGVGAFAVGTATGRAVVVSHGVAGIAVAVLAPWKQQIVRRGLRRRRRARWAGLALLVTTVVTLASGVAQAVGAAVPVPVTVMQVHVGAAVLMLIPIVWHVRTRPVRPRVGDVSRRALLRAGGVAVMAAAGWAAAERVYAAAGVTRRFTGSHERGSDDPARMPVTQWLADAAPTVDPDRWVLSIEDRLGSRRLALADLRAAPPRSRRAVLDCTGGWYAAQTWTGVPLADLVDVRDAQRLVVTSLTGYSRAFPVAMVDDLLLALDVAGTPLSVGHGAPARLVAPGRRGFWWVKWVTHIGVDDRPSWLQMPFPAR